MKCYKKGRKKLIRKIGKVRERYLRRERGKERENLYELVPKCTILFFI